MYKYLYLVVTVLIIFCIFVVNGISDTLKVKPKIFVRQIIYPIEGDVPQFKFESQDEILDGMCVDLDGIKGLYIEYQFDPFDIDYAILAPFTKVNQQNYKIIAYDISNDIAIIQCDRWNNKFVDLSSPQINEYFQHCGFKFSVLDAYRVFKLGSGGQYH